MEKNRILLGVAFIGLILVGNPAFAQIMYKFQFVAEGDVYFCEDMTGVVLAELVLQNPPPFEDATDFVSLTLTAEGAACVPGATTEPYVEPTIWDPNPLDLDAVGLGSVGNASAYWSLVSDPSLFFIEMYTKDTRIAEPILNADLIIAGVDLDIAIMYGRWEQIPFSNDSPYEVWSCGEFNLQGYRDDPIIQYYPFGAKIANLRKIDRDTTIYAISFTRDGSQFGYALNRTDGAPVNWFHLDVNGALLNTTQLFSNCSYSSAIETDSSGLIAP